jgi:Flp pilus assembly protein TadG
MRTEMRQSSLAEIDGWLAVTCHRRAGASAHRREAASPEGSSILEFAFIVPLFLLLLFAVMDFSRLFYVELTLQNAVRQAGRYAITGNHMADPKNPGQNLSRVGSIIQVAQNAAQGLDVAAIQISSLNGGAGSAGGPGDTVTISLTTNLQLMTSLVAQFFKNGTYTFTVSVSFKNESFPPSDTT